MIELPKTKVHLLDLATLVDNIITNDAFHLAIDGTQGDNWSILVEEGEAIKDLPPLVYFRQTCNGIQVGQHLPMYSQYQMIGTMGRPNCYTLSLKIDERLMRREF